MVYPVPPWILILSGLLTPVIALIAAYVAWRQWQTAKDRLRLDLFDRRLAIYNAAFDFIRSISLSGGVDQDELRNFWTGLHGAEFLLDSDLCKYLREDLWNKALELHRLDSFLTAHTIADDEHARNARERGEVQKWLLAQFEVLTEKFGKILKMPT
jgi:hypothetical protein